MALWARRHVPDDAVVGMWDPGIFTFFSERRVVSFDPLMNSLDYQSGDLLDPVGYVERQRVAYMFGVADRRADGVWNYVPLPPGAHDIVWLPYPDLSIGFSPAKRQHFAVVRPRTSPAAAFLDVDDFPCGMLYPNDPARRRVVTRDRDRLVRGEAVAADIVRLWLALPDTAPPLELRADDEVVARFDGGTRGLHNVDVSAYRGARLSLHHADDDPARVVEQAHLVDYEW